MLILPGIVIREQSLHTAAPSAPAQFAHHLALLTSRSDAQRRDALSFITHALSSASSSSGRPPAAVLLPKLLPLVLDGSPAVRAQLLKVLAALPAPEAAGARDALLPYVRAGMTHLAADVRASALEVLGWAMGALGAELVGGAGAWVKTLKSFVAALGWAGAEEGDKQEKWTSGRASFGTAEGGGKARVKALTVLAAFLRLGLVEKPAGLGEEMGSSTLWPLWHTRQHMLPQRSNCYAYLGLFGTVRDEDNEIYEDAEARQRIFKSRFRRTIEKGLEAAKRESGEMGRAAGIGLRVLKEALAHNEEEQQ